MVITRVARVAPRRQAIILARPAPAYARSFSFWDLFRRRKAAPEESTETKTTETEAAESKTSDTQTAEAQEAEALFEKQLNEDESVEEQPEEFKETYRDWLARRKAQRTQPVEKEPYRRRHGSKWADTLLDRIKVLQERQRVKKDIPHSLWREIGRVNATINQNWSRVYASGEGFLTPRENVAGLIKQEVAWGDIDAMVRNLGSVMYSKYAEASRFNWIHGLSEYRKDLTKGERRQYLELMTQESIGLNLLSVKILFKSVRVSPDQWNWSLLTLLKPIKFPDRVSVYHRIVKPPDLHTTKLVLEAIILSENNRRVAARCMEELTVYDFKEDKTATLRPNQVRDLNRIFRKQPSNREFADKEIDEFIDRLTDVEMKLQNLPPPEPTQPSEESPKDPMEALIKGRRLQDIPLKPEAVVESAIDEALRATDELESGINQGSQVAKKDPKDAEASEDPENPNDLQASKDEEASKDSESPKDTVSESSESKESKDAPKV
ncbi:hypothetical protein N0V84_012574 [Fusarium piperis]|uniref:Uncharacterized protein n=1 Tax=Fusarium piperis TaxID=1435070 RepID=A0A9W8TB80_9HYPO|nr:hypothetical protein N0V84_012574 [Fusarium piperis]